jgi:uncharacterized protein YjbJ (UPF0337 family)
MATTLDADRLKHEWNEIKAKVRERWNTLSDDDLTIHGGNVEQFVNRLHKTTGEDVSAIESYLASLLYGSPAAVARYAVEARELLGEKTARAATIVRRHPSSSFGSALFVGLLVGIAVGLVVRDR